MRGPQHAGELVRQIIKQTGAHKAHSAHGVALEKVLSKSQQAQCRVIGFRNGRLVLEVDSAPLFAELSGFQREELRLRINELVPNDLVAELQFRLGGTGHV